MTRGPVQGSLSAGQLSALRNLSDKKAGRDVDWITISDARALTDLGFAQRNQAGWQITAQGEAALLAADGSRPPSGGPDY
ncbi:MAG: hypothetical protein P4L73_02125 [Caulobacteraceae bacterium]|nr:hypothetical protein [Caulobacteraceae bacterium]